MWISNLVTVFTIKEIPIRFLVIVEMIFIVYLVFCLNIVGMENGYLTWVQLLDTIKGDVDLSSAKFL